MESNKMTIWKYVKAEQFFPAYCPHIKSYTHNVWGKHGRGNPTRFSGAEVVDILDGLRKMIRQRVR
jgi:hypothetical protein